jgi:hypothetical protein
MFANLAGRRVVACFCVNAERGKTLGSPQFDLDLAPAGVAGAIARVVTQDILVAQFHANFLQRSPAGRLDSSLRSRLLAPGRRAAGSRAKERKTCLLRRFRHFETGAEPCAAAPVAIKTRTGEKGMAPFGCARR